MMLAFSLLDRKGRISCCNTSLIRYMPLIINLELCIAPGVGNWSLQPLHQGTERQASTNSCNLLWRRCPGSRPSARTEVPPLPIVQEECPCQIWWGCPPPTHQQLPLTPWSREIYYILYIIQNAMVVGNGHLGKNWDLGEKIKEEIVKGLKISYICHILFAGKKRWRLKCFKCTIYTPAFFQLSWRCLKRGSYGAVVGPNTAPIAWLTCTSMTCHLQTTQITGFSSSFWSKVIAPEYIPVSVAFESQHIENKLSLIPRSLRSLPERFPSEVGLSGMEKEVWHLVLCYNCGC